MDKKMNVFEWKPVSVAIRCNWRRLYEEFWRPETFPRWASGLSDASLKKIDGEWKAEGPEGPVTIVFTEHNDYGVMDHRVLLGEGRAVYVPLRVVENGGGSEVTLMLFRQPGISDAKFVEDVNWVRSDLERLKRLVEG